MHFNDDFSVFQHIKNTRVAFNMKAVKFRLFVPLRRTPNMFY